MEQFKKGHTVSWTSQSKGYTKTKTGVVAEVVEAGVLPAILSEADWKARRALRLARVDRSYIVKVGEKLYWPLTKYLSAGQGLDGSAR